MAADPSPGLQAKIQRMLRRFLPFEIELFLEPNSLKVLKCYAARYETQPEFVFFETVATLSALSRKIVLKTNDQLQIRYPNLFNQVVSGPKSGKTNSFKVSSKIRQKAFNRLNLNNSIKGGTTQGIYSQVVECANRMGLPLFAVDEGMSHIIGLIDKPGSSDAGFDPEVFLSSSFSSAPVHRHFASRKSKDMSDTPLSILAMGTFPDILRFHKVCQQHYLNRGLLGRFITFYMPAFSSKCSPPVSESASDDSMLAASLEVLERLLEDGFVEVGKAAERLNFNGFILSVDAVELIESLQNREMKEEDETEKERSWQETLSLQLLGLASLEFRRTEMVQKWAVLLHLLDILLGAIDFPQRQVNRIQIREEISKRTVQRAQNLVDHARAQDNFLMKVYRITQPLNRDLKGRQEHADFILYDNLLPIFLIWPGPVVTSESAIDRTTSIGIRLPFDQMCDAFSILSNQKGPTTKGAELRKTGAGEFEMRTSPTQEFRFYKNHPDVVNLEMLKEYNISLELYTSRFHMDFFQIVETGAIREKRTQRTYSKWLNQRPKSVLPNEVIETDVAGSSGNMNSVVFPTFTKHQKFQHEAKELRFKPQQPPSKKRKEAAEDQNMQFFQIAGIPPFSNQKQ